MVSEIWWWNLLKCSSILWDVEGEKTTEAALHGDTKGRKQHWDGHLDQPWKKWLYMDITMGVNLLQRQLQKKIITSWSCPLHTYVFPRKKHTSIGMNSWYEVVTKLWYLNRLYTLRQVKTYTSKLQQSYNYPSAS